MTMKVGPRFATNAVKFRCNSEDGGKNDDIPGLIDSLITSEAFSSADKTALQALPPDTIRALAEKFLDGEIEEVVEEVIIDFAHAHRPKAMRRELPEVRASRNFGIAHAHERKLIANAVEDEEAKGMVPPSSRRAAQ